MTSRRSNTGGDNKKQQRLKTVHLGAAVKIVVCLEVNIFQSVPLEGMRARRLDV